MISIQDAGIEILGDNPKSLYFFCGPEYGIKVKYLEHLAEYYSGKIESEDMSSVLSSFRKKSLISTKDSLYVVRYDSDFLSTLNEKKAKELLAAPISGTLVVLYSEESSFKKLDRYFPDNVIRFDSISNSMIRKYLSTDFPELDDIHIQYVADYCDDYYQAQQICRSIEQSKTSTQDISKGEFLYIFGLSKNSSEDQFRIALASKNYPAMIQIIEEFDDDLNYLLNCICNVMVELDKIFDNRRTDSILQPYIKKWTRPDIYYMFSHTYNEIIKLRSFGISNIEDSLVYLLSLVRFKNIPSLEDVK